MRIYKIANNMTKTAVTDGEFRDQKDRIDRIKSDITDIKRDNRDFENRLKKIEKAIDNLNVGNRLVTETKTIFNSLQRKVERMEAVTQEWNNYKKEMESDIKKQVEKHTKARINSITPQAY